MDFCESDEKIADILKKASKQVCVGSVYRHYKSQDALYKIENVALRELDFVPLVIYRSLENNFVWARTLQEFLGFACSGKKRFVKVDERV